MDATARTQRATARTHRAAARTQHAAAVSAEFGPVPARDNSPVVGADFLASLNDSLARYGEMNLITPADSRAVDAFFGMILVSVCPFKVGLQLTVLHPLSIIGWAISGSVVSQTVALESQPTANRTSTDYLPSIHEYRRNVQP